MTVLICIPCLLIGGTEIQTLNLVRALVVGGYHVVTICYYEYEEKMVEQYRAAGCKVELLSSEGVRVHGWRQLWYLYHGLRKSVRKYHPAVVHVQYMAPGALPCLILKLLGVSRIIVTVHTTADNYSNFSLSLIHFIQKYCVNVFTCISEGAEKSFFYTSQKYSINQKINRRNHFTIYNCLSHSFTPLDKERSFTKFVTIGIVSRLEYIKGVDLAVPAFYNINKKYRNTQLLIIGEGSLHASMNTQVKEMKLENCVSFVGKQEHDKLQEFYNKIDILLIPSRSEGFGLTAIEGMSRGCVIVASDTGGLPEIIPKGAGLLHERGSIESIVQQISYLLKNRSRMACISKQGMQNASKYHEHAYNRIIQDLYQNILCTRS